MDVKQEVCLDVGLFALRRRGITAANISSLMLNLWRLHESETESFDDVNFTLHNTSFDNHLRFFEMKLGCQVGDGGEGKVSKLTRNIFQQISFRSLTMMSSRMTRYLSIQTIISLLLTLISRHLCRWLLWLSWKGDVITRTNINFFFVFFPS